VIYQSEKALEELGDKVSESEKAPIQAAVEKLRETLKGTDVAAIKADTEAVQQAFYAISEKLYQQQAADAGAAGAADAGASNASDDGVVDADYEVVDDDQ
jgi:molecular chaperone DnaK